MKPEPPTTYKSYVRDALRTEANHMDAFARICADPRKMRLLHAITGIVDEAGELNKALKAHLFYGANLDLVNLKEEVGDLLWFVALIADCLGEANLTNMMQTNIAKLRHRYPEKFSEEKAEKRDLEGERKVLEQQKSQFACDKFEPHPTDIYCAKCGRTKESHI